ncbi:flagellar motor protein MotB [Spirochaetia bacterium]|nr:flagellar motor protein MotB [Spirochaetia bacterium]
MVTLLLCFFVALFQTDEAIPDQVQAMISSLNNIGMGVATGGSTVTAGKSANLGNTVSSLPSMDRGKSTGNSAERAMALFSPEVKSNKVRITHDERGIIISLASDAFFDSASARVNIEETRDILIRLAGMFNSADPNMVGRNFRIEGHTDSIPVSSNGPWESNWELSTARSIAILHYLTDLGVDEKRFQVSGFASTNPVATNDTPEGRAQNRRVDIVILDEAHL